MKQTAVEWLVEKLKSQGLLIGEPDNLVAVNQAKEMEKQSKLDLIRFMRTSDKMGRSVEDLYDEFCG